MGNNNESPKTISPSTRENQQRIIQEAGQLVRQLQLDQTQTAFKERKHLIARILIYGHRHLVEHLRKFNKQDRKKHMRYLRNVDYQTIDLLFHKLVKNSLISTSETHKYQQYKPFDKRNISLTQLAKYSLKGKQLHNIVGLILFMGGSGTRFNSICKELYKQNNDQQSIFDVYINDITSLYHQGFQISIFFICNQKNYKEVSNKVRQSVFSKNCCICMQNSLPALNLNGYMCLKQQNTFEIVQMSNGCGDFIKSSIQFQHGTLIQEMKKKQIKYAYLLSCQNYLANIADFFMFGFLVQHQYDVLFKCTYPENRSQKFQRVVSESDKIKVQYVDKLIQTTTKPNSSMIRQSPIWINDCIINFTKFTQYLEKLRLSSLQSHMFNTVKKKLTYWNPIEETIQKQQYCYVFERELSDILINDQLKSLGVMVERQDQFMPIMTLNHQNSWKEGYKEYLAKKQKKQKFVNKSMFSVVEDGVKSQDDQRDNFENANIINNYQFRVNINKTAKQI